MQSVRTAAASSAIRWVKFRCPERPKCGAVRIINKSVLAKDADLLKRNAEAVVFLCCDAEIKLVEAELLHNGRARPSVSISSTVSTDALNRSD